MTKYIFNLGSTNPADQSSCCTVLGTTRALGVNKQVARHGVRHMTVYQPNIDYPDLSPAAQITDDEHSPYYTWNRLVIIKQLNKPCILNETETNTICRLSAWNKELVNFGVKLMYLSVL